MITVGILQTLTAIAVLASIGMFLEFGDRATRIVVSFVAAVVWGIVGLASYDVVVPTGTTTTTTGPILPMVYVGLGFAMVTGLFAIYELVAAAGAEANATETDEFI